MRTQKILLPALTATSLMTLFSHLVAAYENKNFSESELLAKIEKKQFHLSKKVALPAGWTTHYAIGVLMVTLFEIYKSFLKKKPAFYHTTTFGVFGGLLAIVSWRLLFEMLPSRSSRYYKKFYTQLFIAHLIFAGTVTVTQKAIKNY